MNSENCIQKWTTNRHYTYALFAGIFLKEPAADSWFTIQDIFNEFSSYSGEKNVDGEPSSKELISEAKLRQEYYDCFFVPISGKYIPPYESALRGYQNIEKKLTFGNLGTDITAQVKKQYDFVGFDPLMLNAFPPLKNIQLADHIGYELAFMAYLCQCEKKAREANQQKKGDKWLEFQEDFIAKHILQWTPKLKAALNAIRDNIFKKTAWALDSWVSFDYQDLIEYKNTGGVYIEC